MSHTPINLFRDWLEAYVSTAGYTISRGMWEETNNSTKKFVAVWSNPGRSPNGDIQYPQIRVIVTGRANGRALGDTEAAELFAESLFDAAIEHFSTSCMMNIRPLGSIQGPYYTETNRNWYEINFELAC
jgi:hypothetical protein|nr:MAG TPA: tail completion protein [Caudoviricetes sp.]